MFYKAHEILRSDNGSTECYIVRRRGIVVGAFSTVDLAKQWIDEQHASKNG